MGCYFKKEKGIPITNSLQKVSNESDASQEKYAWINAVNFTVDQKNCGQKVMIQKCIQHVMKKNLWLQKDLLKP